jgi:tRNA (guanine-N7-)-methyltransferase
MTKTPEETAIDPRRRVFGRKLGRPLRGGRQSVIDELLPLLRVKDETEAEGIQAPSMLFDTPSQDIVFEIGFGNGEHLKAMLEQRPDRNYIGAEPFINGMSAFLKSILAMPHGNIRVWMDDAVTLIRSFEAKSLSAIYILNPDPWPKKRHHKRRIVRQETLEEYFRVLKPGGDLVMATDVDDLAEWMVTETMNHGGFEWQAECASDWKTMPQSWFLTTRYAAKGEKAGRKETYLLFRKKA